MSPHAHRRDIDGLRAVAVLAVVWFHCGLGFPGGYVGVDVFFVISGYLITSLMLRDLDAGTFRLADFWERRLRRILPPLVAVVAVTFAAGCLLLLPGDVQRLGQAVAAQAVMASNFFGWRHAGYFAPAADSFPLLHLWSLAIEEQFYLVMPLALVALHRFRPRWIAPAGVLLCVASLGLSIYGVRQSAASTFYLLPTRAWELLAGGLLAGAPVITHRRAAELLSALGLGAIVYATCAYGPRTPFPGSAALLPCGGAALVIWAGVGGTTLIGRLLAGRPLVFIGAISYSLYLWHWPLVVFTRYALPHEVPLAARGLLFAASLLAATASWRWIETPFRTRRLLPQRRPLFAVSAVATAVLLVAGLLVARSDGFRSRYAPADLALIENVERQLAVASERDALLRTSLQDVARGRWLEVTPGLESQPVDVLIWGDSHARSALPAFETLGVRHRRRTVAAVQIANAPLLGFTPRLQGAAPADARRYNAEVVDVVRRHRIPNVVLIARWAVYDYAGRRTTLAARLEETVAELRRAGSDVWIVCQVPDQHLDVPRALVVGTLRGYPEDELGITWNDHCAAQAAVRRDIDRMQLAGAHVIDPAELMLNAKGRCRIEFAGRALYRDDDHLGPAGAAFISAAFHPIYDGPATRVSRSGPPASANSN